MRKSAVADLTIRITVALYSVSLYRFPGKLTSDIYENLLARATSSSCHVYYYNLPSPFMDVSA